MYLNIFDYKLIKSTLFEFSNYVILFPMTKTNQKK
jgi:hypothetical protein